MEGNKEPPKLKKEVYERMFGYISAGLGVVVGLAWNEAISEALNTLFPIEKDNLSIKFLYAAAMTLVIVIVIRYLHKIIERLEQ